MWFIPLCPGQNASRQAERVEVHREPDAGTNGVLHGHPIFFNLDLIFADLLPDSQGLRHALPEPTAV